MPNYPKTPFQLCRHPNRPLCLNRCTHSLLQKVTVNYRSAMSFNSTRTWATEYQMFKYHHATPLDRGITILVSLYLNIFKKTKKLGYLPRRRRLIGRGIVVGNGQERRLGACFSIKKTRIPSTPSPMERPGYCGW
jgi:hypothetical protein